MGPVRILAEEGRRPWAFELQFLMLSLRTNR